MPDEDFQSSEVHPISEVSTGKWVLLLVAIAYVAGSLFLIFNLRGRLDQLSKDQAASSAQIVELTKRMQSAEASDETLAQQVGITKKELASRAAAITRAQRAAEARLAEQQQQRADSVLYRARPHAVRAGGLDGGQEKSRGLPEHAEERSGSGDSKLARCSPAPTSSSKSRRARQSFMA